MAGRHYQVRQHRLLGGPGPRGPSSFAEFVHDPVRPELTQKVELTLPRRLCAAVGQVDDLALLGAVDRGMRRIDETAQAFGEPVITPRLPRSPFMPCWTTTQRPSSVTMKPWR